MFHDSVAECPGPARSKTPSHFRAAASKDGADYIMKLPKGEQSLAVWQAATEALHAWVGVLRALNRHVEQVFNSNRKDTNWSKRKLKRDL